LTNGQKLLGVGLRLTHPQPGPAASKRGGSGQQFDFTVFHDTVEWRHHLGLRHIVSRLLKRAPAFAGMLWFFAAISVNGCPFEQ
jgi:hypothetical protein